MARNISDYNGVVIAPGGDYPFGRIKNAPSGTVANETSNGDLQQFFQKLMFESGITPNGLADNDANGYQIYQALQEFGNNYVSPIIINIIGASYDPTKVYILSGAETRADDGYAFYNGSVYFIGGNGGPICGGATVDVLVDHPEETGFSLKVLLVECATAGTGVADFADVIRTFGIENWTSPSLNATWTNTSATVKYRKDNQGRVYLIGEPKTTSSTPNQIIFTLPAGYRPTQLYVFVNRQLDGATPSKVSIGVFANGDVAYVDGPEVPVATNVSVNFGTMVLFTT